MVIDTYADTACAGKYAFVEEFVMGKFITAKGFTTYLGSIDNITISNILYTYDATNGETIILEEKNSIYLCDKMYDLLLNTIQAEEIGVRVDTNPKSYYLDNP